MKTKQSGGSLEGAMPHRNKEVPDFLLWKGWSGSHLPKEDEEPPALNSRILYIGRIPHGFYEEQMQGFFKQFGTIKRLRVARNRKTGKSKHYGFIEFKSPEVEASKANMIHQERRIERMRYNKDRTAEEHKKLVDAIMRRDLKRRNKIKGAGIDYECPDIVGVRSTPRKLNYQRKSRLKKFSVIYLI